MEKTYIVIIKSEDYDDFEWMLEKAEAVISYNEKSSTDDLPELGRMSGIMELEKFQIRKKSGNGE